MKIRIDNFGCLEIDGKSKYCPYTTNFEGDEGCRCSDDCALFAVDQSPSRIKVILCRKEYIVYPEDFTDERPKS